MTSTQPSYEGTLPSFPDRALEVFLSIMLDLKTVHLQEMDALNKKDMKAFMDLQSRKILLARDYEVGAKEIIVRTDNIKQASKPLRDLVIKEQMELQRVSEQTERVLQRMTTAVKRVNNRLIDAARHAVKQDKINYDHKGSIDSTSQRMTATAINESF